MAKTPEGDVKNIIKKWCKKHNLWYVMIVPSPYGRSTGVSDFQILHNGLFIVIEAKAKTDTKGPTPNQQKYIDSVIENGGKAYVVRNEEDLISIEEDLGWPKI